MKGNGYDIFQCNNRNLHSGPGVSVRLPSMRGYVPLNVTIHIIYGARMCRKMALLVPSTYQKN
jgi:hypothetical protein